MSRQSSGGLAGAISGELPTGVSENRKEPEPIKCKWPCPTVLRIAMRKAALKLRDKLAALETVDLKSIDPEHKDEYEAADKTEDGLCAVHAQMTRDYLMGLGFERPPFMDKVIKKI